MTGYGRSSKATALGRFVLEVHSVNRKMLDLSIYLPRDFLRFDVEIRKWVSQAVERGHVTVKVTVQTEGMEEQLLSTRFSQLKALKEGWEHLSAQLGFDSEQAIQLPFLVSQLQPTSFLDESEDEVREILHGLILEALKSFTLMKEEEGKALEKDFQKRLTLIEETLELVEQKREEPLIKYQQKLHTLLKSTEHSSLETDERLLREVALLAEKIDITEELVRLKTHIDQFRSHLKTPQKAVGRTLDFCLQEMNREANTMGSKSADSNISAYVVKIKSELEKIREQIQNIE